MRRTDIVNFSKVYEFNPRPLRQGVKKPTLKEQAEKAVLELVESGSEAGLRGEELRLFVEENCPAWVTRTGPRKRIWQKAIDCHIAPEKQLSLFEVLPWLV